MFRNQRTTGFLSKKMFEKHDGLKMSFCWDFVKLGSRFCIS